MSTLAAGLLGRAVARSRSPRSARPRSSCRSAGTARPAWRWTCSGSGSLSGIGSCDDLARSGRSRRRAARRSRRAAPRPPRRSRSSPRLNGDSRAVHRISSTHERPMPAITRWSRSTRVQRPRAARPSSAREVRGRVGPRLRARASRSRRRPSSAVACAAPSPTPPACVPNSRSRSSRPSSRRRSSRDVRSRSAGALVEELQAPGAHQVDEQRAGRRRRRRRGACRCRRTPVDRAARRARAAAGRTSSAR